MRIYLNQIAHGRSGDKGDTSNVCVFARKPEYYGIIAREVTNDKELLIAVNPTRGLDVGAIEFGHTYIVEQRNRNRAVLLVSFELDEIMSLSDRIEVIFDGRITGSVPGKDADEKELGFMMAGGKQHE